MRLIITVQLALSIALVAGTSRIQQLPLPAYRTASLVGELVALPCIISAGPVNVVCQFDCAGVDQRGPLHAQIIGDESTQITSFGGGVPVTVLTLDASGVVMQESAQPCSGHADASPGCAQDPAPWVCTREGGKKGTQACACRQICSNGEPRGESSDCPRWCNKHCLCHVEEACPDPDR